MLSVQSALATDTTPQQGPQRLNIALGAQASQVSMLVLRQGIRPVIGGLLVGVAAALAAGQLIRSFLFGTEARDPAAISAVVMLQLVIAAVAC
jgi:hypothetical protein